MGWAAFDVLVAIFKAFCYIEAIKLCLLPFLSSLYCTSVKRPTSIKRPLFKVPRGGRLIEVGLYICMIVKLVNCSVRKKKQHVLPFCFGRHAQRTISFPEAAILLVSDGDHDLWPGPTPEVRDSRTSRHSAHAQS